MPSRPKNLAETGMRVHMALGELELPGGLRIKAPEDLGLRYFFGDEDKRGWAPVLCVIAKLRTNEGEAVVEIIKPKPATPADALRNLVQRVREFDRTTDFLVGLQAPAPHGERISKAMEALFAALKDYDACCADEAAKAVAGDKVQQLPPPAPGSAA